MLDESTQQTGCDSSRTSRSKHKKMEANFDRRNVTKEDCSQHWYATVFYCTVLAVLLFVVLVRNAMGHTALERLTETTSIAKKTITRLRLIDLYLISKSEVLWLDKIRCQWDIAWLSKLFVLL